MKVALLSAIVFGAISAAASSSPILAEQQRVQQGEYRRPHAPTNKHSHTKNKDASKSKHHHHNKQHHAKHYAEPAVKHHLAGQHN